jgi:hypothetical protein
LLSLLLGAFLVRRAMPLSPPPTPPESETASPESAGERKPAENAAASTDAPAAATAPVHRAFRLHDDAGRPLRAKIRVAMSWDQFKTAHIVETESDASGSADLAFDPTAWVMIDVRAPGHRGQLRPPVTWGDLNEDTMEFALEPATPVELYPISGSGAPASNLRLRLAPEWPTGDFAGLAARKMGIVDEEVLTDAQGRATFGSLRAGPYIVSFPDHPKWPGVRVSAEDLAKPSLPLRLTWRTEP